jgi:hypothetical protein
MFSHLTPSAQQDWKELKDVVVRVGVDWWCSLFMDEFPQGISIPIVELSYWSSSKVVSIVNQH